MPHLEEDKVTTTPDCMSIKWARGARIAQAVVADGKPKGAHMECKCARTVAMTKTPKLPRNCPRNNVHVQCAAAHITPCKQQH